MSSSWLGSGSGRQMAGLAALVTVAAALRLRGLDFGLPLLSNYYIRPDETLVVIPAVELFSRLGNPGHINYPAAMMDVLAVVYRGMHAVLAMAGEAYPAFLDDVGAHPSRYFLAGRLLSAACGVVLTVIVYRVAIRFASPLAAAIAAAWYAVSPLAVREAHFAVTDTAMALLVACGVLAAMRVVEAAAATDGTRRRALIVCGVVAGAAVATKYTAVVAAGAIAGSLLWPHRARFAARAREVGLVVLAAMAMFAILNPWLMTHPGTLIEWITQMARAIYTARPALAADPGFTTGWTRVTDYAGLMPGGMLGAASATAGLLVAAVRWLRGESRLLVLLLTTLAFVALFAPSHTLPFRYLSPLLPLSAILSAVALEALRQRMHHPMRHGAATAGVAGLIGVAMTAPASVHLANSLTLEDTRSEAGRWISTHVPSSVPIVWLGAPESEPQIRETPASIRRRVTYVEQTYGPVAARVIDRVYLLALRAPNVNDPPTHEVLRNPKPEDVPPGIICVVQATYPSPTVVTDAAQRADWTRGDVQQTAHIGRPLPPRRHLLEPWDAFFLPLNLDRTTQPGPEFVIALVERR